MRKSIDFILVFVFLTLIVLATSCTPKVGECQIPYIDYTDDECCLDDDGDGVCDFLDSEEEVEVELKDKELSELVDENEVVISEYVVKEDPIPEVIDVEEEEVIEEEEVEEVEEEEVVVVEQEELPSNFKFDLRALKVSKIMGDLGGQLEHNNFYLTTPDISQKEKVLVEFVPECIQHNVNQLFTIINGRRESGVTPRCEQVNKVYLTKNFLKTGLNTIVFDTVDKQYFIDDIYIITNVGLSNQIRQKINRVLLNAFTKKIQVDTGHDLEVMRQDGFDFVVGKTDIRDLVVSFEAEEAVGDLIVEVNNQVVYRGEIKDGLNDILIPEGVLVLGRNNLIIMGD